MSPPRAHPLARSKAAEWANRSVAALWARKITPKPPLDPDYLWQIGARGFESDDEHSIRSVAEIEDFRTRLDRICTSLREEARLNSLGHTMAYGQLTGAIRKRLALGRLWREQPQLAGKSIAPPIIVVGQMRAGTTRMHRLLAADPRHAGTRFCNSHDPLPKAPDYRPLKAAAGLAIARRINPWLDTLHPFGATRVDEEIGWLSQSLSSCAYEAQWHIPSFVAWSETRDPTPIYAEFARILRTDAAIMGDTAKPRVLKCPQFAEDLPALLAQFPDARLVVAQRNREDVLRSSVSLVASQKAFQSDDIRLTDIESEWRRKLALRQRRIDAALARFSGTVARVDFEALETDWRGEISRTYAALGMGLCDNAFASLEKEYRRSSGDAHHAHRSQIGGFTPNASTADV